MKTIKHIRGSTFSANCVFRGADGLGVDVTAITITSSFRDKITNRLLSNAVVTKDPDQHGD